MVWRDADGRGPRLRWITALAGTACLLAAWHAAASMGPSPAAAVGVGVTASAVPAGAVPPAPRRPATSSAPASRPATRPAAATPTSVTPPTPVAVPGAVGAGAQASVRAHWSPGTMESAQPVDPAPAPVRSAAPPVTAPASTGAPAPADPTTSTSTPSGTTGGTTTGSTTSSTTSTEATGSASSTLSTVTADPGSRWPGGGLVARTTGRVFFTLGGIDYSCSGSAVDSADASTVLTAAHCVEGTVEGRAAFAKRWVFVPGYDQGQAPYGIFVATRLVALAGYAAGDLAQDVAMVNVGPGPDGRALGATVGGQPVEFLPPAGRTAGEVQAFGYPAEAPYDGRRLVRCAGRLHPDRDTADSGLPCALTRGASGGPWLSHLDPVTGRGTIVSVTSFGYDTEPGVLYGPPLGPAAAALYDAVARDPLR